MSNGNLQQGDLRFDGPDYDPELDQERLSSQFLRIRRLMMDNQHTWLTLGEIEDSLGYPQASISAQLRHMRKRRFGSFVVQKRRRGEGRQGLWEYRVVPPYARIDSESD